MKLLPTSAARAASMTMLRAKKNSPHIFFGIGLLGAIGSVVLACRATLDLEDTLEEVREDIIEANAKANKEVVDRYTQGQDLTPEIIDRAEYDRAMEVSVVTVKGALAVGKLYLPASIVGGIAIACLTGSHVQLTRRNAALTALATALMKSYDEYRVRVANEIGKEREAEIYRSVEIHEITDEDGKKQLVRAVNPDGMSEYARIYDASNAEWKNNAEWNKTILIARQHWANSKLERDGYLMLNDVYDALGFERSKAGCIVGWIRNSEVGDNYVDFGIFEARNTDFINQLEPSIWLDFNVDGVVWDLLP